MPVVRSATRAAGLTAAVAGLAVFAWLAVQVYRAQADPEGFEAWSGRFAWIVGPTSKSLNRAAQAHVDAGLASLNDTSRPWAERLEGYRSNLAAADRLLVRSLRANPAQARTLAQLAAIRWEIEMPASGEAAARYLEMIAAASRMAPRVPDVQVSLGDLLLRMGRRDDAIPYLRRAIDLDPSFSWRGVELLRQQLMTAAEIADALPPAPSVLVALEEPFLQEGRGADYLGRLEGALDRGGAGLLAAYGDACLRGGEAGRLKDRLDRLGPRGEPEVEAERLRQRSAARLALGDTAGAVDDARTARSARPDDPSFAEHLGRVALAAGRGDDAVRAYREALSVVSRASGDRSWRARLYSEIGRAEESLRRPGPAFDAYRMAVGLEPGIEPARSRLEEMERAARVGAPRDAAGRPLR